MPYQFSVWLDDETAKALDNLAHNEDRKRGAMIKVLIRRAIQDLRDSGWIDKDNKTSPKIQENIGG